ncbi:MAG: hypothetical protein ABMA64_03825 [Myxococcota bacterium]
MIALWHGSAGWAQDTPPPEEPYEVIVYGELRVKQAHDALIEQLAEMGYDGQVLDLGNHTVYRHDSPWKGEVVVYDDGWMQVRRQPFYVEGVELPWAKRNSPVAWAGCLIWPWACLKLSGSTYGERKWRQVEDEAAFELDPKLRVWGDRIADLAVDRKVEALPDRLTLLWRDGAPLDDGPVLATPAERRRALFEFWASRTDTVWGREVQRAVEAFCRAEVQTSEHPFTPEELASFAALHPEPVFDPNPRPPEADPPAEAVRPTESP